MRGVQCHPNMGSSIRAPTLLKEDSSGPTGQSAAQPIEPAEGSREQQLAQGGALGSY